MFDVKAYHQHTGKTTLDFLMQALIVIRVVAVAKQAGCFQLLMFILDDMDSAKGNLLTISLVTK